MHLFLQNQNSERNMSDIIPCCRERTNVTCYTSGFAQQILDVIAPNFQERNSNKF